MRVWHSAKSTPNALLAFGGSDLRIATNLTDSRESEFPSELEDKLKAVENVEKLELAAKLAEAEARFNDTEIEKYKRALKDENDEWLRIWSLWLAGIIGLSLFGVKTPLL